MLSALWLMMSKSNVVVLHGVLGGAVRCAAVSHDLEAPAHGSSKGSLLVVVVKVAIVMIVIIVMVVMLAILVSRPRSSSSIRQQKEREQ